MKLDLGRWITSISSTGFGDRIYFMGIWTPFVRVAQGFVEVF